MYSKNVSQSISPLLCSQTCILIWDCHLAVCIALKMCLINLLVPCSNSASSHFNWYVSYLMFVCFIPPLIFISVILLSILTLSRFLKSYFSCFLVLIVFQLIQLAQFDIPNISLILCCSFLFTSSAFLSLFFFSRLSCLFLFSF